MKTLFLNPPSVNGFDGGAGSRYQARREIRSFWYPTWLAQPAALIPESRLVDAPARGLTLEQVLPLAGEYELLVMQTSTPSFPTDIQVVEAFKEANPNLMIGLVGPHVAVMPEPSLMASPAVDFVAGSEYEYTLRDIAAGAPFEEVDGISHKKEGKPVHNRPRALIENLDELPMVADVYRRDLVIEDYYIGYLLHPYVSLYTGRGCKARCSFCLWPQTIGGHRYRTRSPAHVLEEMRKIKEYFPQVREVFFDDDTFTGDPTRAEAIARLLGREGMTWSCNARANVPYRTLKVMRENGLRLLLVGFESGNQQILNNITKGIRIETARQFMADCHELGITVHGTFIVGLPGETPETIEKTIAYAREINPHTIQVSLAAAYPGTELYRQAAEQGWLVDGGRQLIGSDGIQVSSLAYPDLSKEEIFEAVGTFYKRFYFRPGKIMEMVSEMVRSPQMLKRRLREGMEFIHFLSARDNC